MGYRIDYGTGCKRGRVLPMLLFGCFFTLLGVCLVPQGRQTVWDMLAGGDGEGLIFRRGEILRKVPQERLVDELMDEIAHFEGE